MRQDQYDKLQALTEKLTDALLGEMDPEQWPGAGMLPSAMDQQTRGDRYWCKKNAAATLTLIMKNTNLVDVIRRQTAAGAGSGTGVEGDSEDENGLEGEIRQAEKEAQQWLNKIQKQASKTR